MVYESDFYTTRRPYSRPLVSSYTVSYRPITIIPFSSNVIPLSSVIQLRTVPHMPYVAHKRLVTIVHSPIHHVYYAGAMIPIRVRTRVRPSILAAELNRIRALPRPSSRSYIEEYLNSRYNILFDDEARDIRAKVDSLLRRVHVFVPRAVARYPTKIKCDFIEEIIPERMRSHDYVRRLLSGRSNAKKQTDYLSWYEVPDRGAFGTLACIKYVAGKPQSIRKPYYKVADLRPADIRNDVNFLSYYSKNRQAAATASSSQPMTDREIRKVRALGYDSTTQEKKTLAPESEEKSEKKAKKKPEPEEEPEPVREPEPEPVPEPAKEPEPVPEPVKPSKPAKASKSARSVKSAKTAEPKAEPEPVKEPEIVKEPEPEPELVKEPEPVSEPEVPAEPIAQDVPIESAEAVSDEAEEEKVKQDREDAIRRAEEYLAKAAREAQSEEERRKAAEEERLQLELEEKKAWEALQLAQERKAELSQILEIEQQEAERKAEEEKLQAEREEVNRIEEEERIINQTNLDALIQEQERLIIEEHLEEVQNQKQEQEEVDITQFAANENKDASCAENPVDFGEISDQEKEEKPYDVTTDDETRVEEENVHEEEPETTEDPFVEEPEGAESKPQTGPTAAEDEPQVEEVTSGEEFEWGDQDS
ncbi:PREDICTED: eukaryotic translation initiation factor 5B-like isoform X1 [Trachymyrmex septentrionalis]|uniref:eukaryotic translation initiation factor 5B-like isoform X1 n=1 Tax=Trachymyrmex septentrionalis TaxID=34720 RepID=UPI00084EF23E|nr:PREDICTED: eukaryotic translation initiation factor 5B-like isoform X1 [Trachymyrmex septentrionalis]